MTVSAPRLVAFDLDDTLAPSKSAIDPRIADLLAALAVRVEVAIISGGHVGQFESQVVDHLPPMDVHVRRRFHLMPTCGAQYYRLDQSGVQLIYVRTLTDEQKRRAAEVSEAEAGRLGLWNETTWGDVIEDRGSQITFSALGQQAPVAAKSAWDPTGAKREALRRAVSPQLPDLEVRSGGSTSIDITEIGIDKAFGMRALVDQTGIPLDAMLFIGDRLDEHGNDYPVRALGVECHAVDSWQDTAAYLETLIPQLPCR